MTAAPPCAATRRLGTSLSRLVDLESGLSRLFRAAERLRCTPNLVGDRIKAIRGVPEQCAALAKQAYWHSNGFAKIKVAETRDLCLRLHIWPAGDNRLGEVDPHGHRWEFASWVAVGAGMREHRFHKLNGVVGGVQYTRCNYNPMNKVEPLKSLGTVALRLETELNRTPGQVYGCDLDVIHTVAPIGTGLVATVVLQGPILRESADVYRLPGRSIADRQSPISPAELDRLFAEVEDAIEAGRPSRVR